MYIIEIQNIYKKKKSIFNFNLKIPNKLMFNHMKKKRKNFMQDVKTRKTLICNDF